MSGWRLRATIAAAARPPAKEHDLVAPHFSRVELVAILVVPLPRLKAALHVDLLAFGEVLGQRFGGLTPEHDAVPLCLLLALAGFVVPDFGGCHVKGGYGRTTGCIAKF